MAYRDDLIALSARHDALTSEVAAKTRELEESRRLLEQARARARLPVLDQIQVASPCTADWNQMTGDDQLRHCGECQKNVYNLSGMTREQAEALVIEHNGDLCVRYFQRQDGTILLADCTVGVDRRRRRRRTVARAAALVAGGLAAAGAMASHTTGQPASDEPPCTLTRMTMGKMEVRHEPEAPAEPEDQAAAPDEDDAAPAPPSMHLPPELAAPRARPPRTPPPTRPEIESERADGQDGHPGRSPALSVEIARPGRALHAGCPTATTSLRCPPGMTPSPPSSPPRPAS